MNTTLSSEGTLATGVISLLPTDILGSVNHANAPMAASVLSSIDNHTLLRLQLNRILHLYTPNKAYAQPHELSEQVFNLSAQLRQWYQSQPLEIQFVRDATTFSMINPSVPLHLVSLPFHCVQRDVNRLLTIYRNYLRFATSHACSYSIAQFSIFTSIAIWSTRSDRQTAYPAQITPHGFWNHAGTALRVHHSLFSFAA